MHSSHKPGEMLEKMLYFSLSVSAFLVLLFFLPTVECGNNWWKWQWATFFPRTECHRFRRMSSICIFVIDNTLILNMAPLYLIYIRSEWIIRPNACHWIKRTNRTQFFDWFSAKCMVLTTELVSDEGFFALGRTTRKVVSGCKLKATRLISDWKKWTTYRSKSFEDF